MAWKGYCGREMGIVERKGDCGGKWDRHVFLCAKIRVFLWRGKEKNSPCGVMWEGVVGMLPNFFIFVVGTNPWHGLNIAFFGGGRFFPKHGRPCLVSKGHLAVERVEKPTWFWTI